MTLLGMSLAWNQSSSLRAILRVNSSFAVVSTNIDDGFPSLARYCSGFAFLDFLALASSNEACLNQFFTVSSDFFQSAQFENSLHFQTENGAGFLQSFSQVFDSFFKFLVTVSKIALGGQGEKRIKSNGDRLIEL